MVCTYFLQRLRQSAATLVRTPCSISSIHPGHRAFSTNHTLSAQIKTKSMTASVENWGLTQQYIELSPKEKIALIPSSRGPISDPKSFLTAIGRGCESYADKFKSWDHLFTATAHEMETDLGVKCAQRKYILGWRDWFKRGIEPYEVKIARRQKKYLKEKAKVQLARLKRQGLA